ncbi:MAG TPA: group II truncated hemoglobin [Vicinamibacterales bacterium]|nr:group II truncated hemoglobin [Vicinamibacterales bacterium]
MVPTLAEWIGEGRLHALTTAFYKRVSTDPLLAPIFAHMGEKHPQHVAAFITEVFGGGTPYTSAGGSHAGMIARHMERHLTEAQRRRWMDLMLDTADAVGLPSDPEFRSAFVGYLEWGTRLAVLNSQPGATAPSGTTPMPAWGWGPPGGPWIAKD